MIRGRYNPVDPVAYGAPVVCPNATTGILSAIAGTNSELMVQVAALWIAPTDRVLEDGVDCRYLPYDDASVDVLVLDPPYQPMHGGANRNFGVGDTYRVNATALQTIEDVLGLYRAGIAEAARVVRPGGRVLVKCQDMTYNHRLHLVHLDVLRAMVDAGFDLADTFVLLNKSRMPQQSARQQRARRSHSYLLVGSRVAAPVPSRCASRAPATTVADTPPTPHGRPPSATTHP